MILRNGHAPVTPSDNGNGGAILGRAQVNDSRFIGNSADGRGGAIYFSYGPGEVRKSRFKGNHAASDGGAIYFVGAMLRQPGADVLGQPRDAQQRGRERRSDLQLLPRLAQ